MDGMFTTTNHSVIVHHEGECIDCQGETTEKSLPSAKEAYECTECDVVVAEESGETVVRGDVSDGVINSFDLEPAF